MDVVCTATCRRKVLLEKLSEVYEHDPLLDPPEIECCDNHGFKCECIDYTFEVKRILSAIKFLSKYLYRKTLILSYLVKQVSKI